MECKTTPPGPHDRSSSYHPRFCQQWDQAPTRHDREGGRLEFRSQCGFPTTWEVSLLPGSAENFMVRNTDYTCDVHVSQAVRRMTDGGFVGVLVAPYRGKEAAL